MSLLFITTNKHKVRQAEAVLSGFGISIKHVDRGYDEPSDDDSETIVRKALKTLLSEFSLPLMIEDTSFYFDAYPGFPGSLSKFMFEKIGYDGIFRLLDGKARAGRFVSTVGYISPGRGGKLFTGEMNGRVISKIMNPDMDTMPYSRIFVPEGFDKTLSELPDEKTIPIMHRTKAFNRLAHHLKGDIDA